MDNMSVAPGLGWPTGGTNDAHGLGWPQGETQPAVMPVAGIHSSSMTVVIADES